MVNRAALSGMRVVVAALALVLLAAVGSMQAAGDENPSSCEVVRKLNIPAKTTECKLPAKPEKLK